MKTIREERIDASIAQLFGTLAFTDKQWEYLKGQAKTFAATWTTDVAAEIKSLKLSLVERRARLEKLTDALLDGAIDRSIFDARKESILKTQQQLRDRLATVEHDTKDLSTASMNSSN